MNKRFYAPYTDWEDFINGMYGTEVKIDQIEKSRLLLLQPKNAMLRVISEWPISSKHNLTNAGSNRKSWLGQAACCINHQSTEFETRLAWKELTKDEQAFANECADEVIVIWEQQNNFNKKNYVKDAFTL